jgi:hypothetical protein
MKPAWLGWLGVMALVACGAPDDAADTDREGALTNITPSDGVQQTIGDCWDFASSGWIEALSRRPDGATPIDISEGLVSYLHWFLQITDPQFRSLDETGSWGRAVEILRRYGWMSETEFLSQA